LIYGLLRTSATATSPRWRGVCFDTVRAIAEIGVDFISSSKVIQAALTFDIGLDEA
jgi:nicotinate-nucleotide pyrophosphorylase